MCLSNVYRLNKENEKELVLKNVASMSMNDGELVFTSLMGVRTVLKGRVENVDLINNFILLKTETE